MNRYSLYIIIFFLAAAACAQERKEYRYAVSYISASVIFIDAGREERIVVGDTLRMERTGKVLGQVRVTAVSKHSCAAQTLSQEIPFALGDGAFIEKSIPVAEAKPDTAARAHSRIDTSISAPSRPSSQPVNKPISRNENIVSGRFGVQYSGVIARDSRFNLSQPSALLRLDIANLLGTGMVFTMYSRNYYDLSDYYNRYGETSRLKNRIYELSVQRDVPESVVGFGVGRMTSRFVGGLGTFDGAQAFVRMGDFSAGAIFGARVGERTMAIDGDDKKGALFLNYRSGKDFFHQYDGTIAYGRQMVESRLDREFIYLQNSLSLGSNLSLYESTEIELNDITNGVRRSAISLSNTFLSVNYYPYQWVSANVGYDATRSVYLFETMKAFPDTLIDKNLMQGFRGSTNFRFPYFISLSLNGSYRTKKGDDRNSHNVGATLRMSDIAGSDVSAGLRYAAIAGIYTDGRNITFDLDRTFFRTLSLSMRYDYYAYTINSLNRSYVTHTVTANINYRISRALYSVLSADKIVDATMNSYRIYAEIGVRF